MTGQTVHVVGLAEFKKSLRTLDRTLPKGIRVALNEAAELLASKIRPQVPVVTGAARNSVRASSSQSAARLSVGGPKAPYYPWLDFGGRVGKNKSTTRRFYKSGRYIYPTLAKEGDEIRAQLLESLTRLARDSGIEVD